jgi:ABC-type glycerol-3-phosphate transport system substrate-binding protein
LKKRQITRLLAILSLLLLSSCSLFLPKPDPQPRIVTVTQVTYPNIQTPVMPQPVELNDVKFYVVTPDNLDEFLKEFEEDNGQIVFVATSVPSYENLSINLQELRRYILQQKEIILYYEQAVDFTDERAAAEARAAEAQANIENQ